jgi:hypothetical protein
LHNYYFLRFLYNTNEIIDKANIPEPIHKVFLGIKSKYFSDFNDALETLESIDVELSSSFTDSELLISFFKSSSEGNILTERVFLTGRFSFVYHFICFFIFLLIYLHCC